MFLCQLSSVLVQERRSFELMARCFSITFITWYIIFLSNSEHVFADSIRDRR